MTTETRDTERDVQTWDLAAGQKLKVRLVTWRGREQVDIRRWYPDDDGELRPGKGIRIAGELAGPLAEVLQTIAEGEV